MSKTFLACNMPIPAGAQWHIKDGQLIVTYGEFVWGKTRNYEFLTEEELAIKKAERAMKRGRREDQ